MAVLFKFQQKKSYRNWNSVVRKILSRVQLKLCMSVCLFEWLTLCEDVGNACAAMAQQSFVVFVLL